MSHYENKKTEKIQEKEQKLLFRLLFVSVSFIVLCFNVLQSVFHLFVLHIFCVLLLKAVI